MASAAQVSEKDISGIIIGDDEAEIAQYIIGFVL